MSRVSPLAALAAGLGFIAPGWRGAWGALALFLGLETLARLATHAWPRFALFWLAVSLLAALLLGTLARAALYRVALQRDHATDPAMAPRAAGLRWGRFESRLLGGRILVGIIVGFVLGFFLVIWAIALGLLMVGRDIDPATLTDAHGPDFFRNLLSGPAGAATVAILGLGSALALYVYARLALLPVMAAETGDFGLGRAIALSRGAALAIMLGAVAIGLGEALLTLIPALIGAGIQTALGASGASYWGAGYWGAIAGPIIGAAFAGPASVGLTAFVYRRQRGDVAGVAATFS